jgi:hypothetical protein
MAIPILAILAAVFAFADKPMVKRLALNLSEMIDTPVIMGTQIDGWVICLFYGAQSLPPGQRKEKIDAGIVEIQAKYTAIKNEAETSGDYTRLHEIKTVGPLVMPWMDATPDEG